MKTSSLIKSALFALATTGVMAASPAFAKDISACLITKTDTNPYFVTMRKGATEEAKKLGIDLKTYAGKYDGDNQSQVDAIESCMAAGVKGILITASDTKAIVPTVEQARKAGILVIALDTTLQPVSAADGTFATDNFLAGKLIGEWAREKMGDKAKDAHIAFLDLATSQPSVGVQRDQGFMTGFGIDVKDPNKWGDETDKRIVGHDVTAGTEQGGLKAMENLLQKDPNTNLVYSINEPAGMGAYQALKSVGMEKKVTIVTIDGSCTGIKDLKEGMFGADSQQYPLLMAADGLKAIKNFADTGKKPAKSKGLDFTNTGVGLVTADPMKGVPHITVKEGLAKCWG